MTSLTWQLHVQVACDDMKEKNPNHTKLDCPALKNSSLH
jgi:hypothetical protein